MKEKTRLSFYPIAATYIGTVVGAGFASGQELFQFFVVFGRKGLLGLTIAAILFIYFGYKIMSLGNTLQADSHLTIIQHLCGRTLARILDGVVVFFLFGSLTAMFAGSGALVSEQFQLTPYLGILSMALLTALTVLAGIKGIMKAISILVPMLLICAVGMSIATFLLFPSTGPSLEITVGNQLTYSFWWSGILYVSYNIILAFSVLGPMGAVTQKKNTLIKGALFGGLGLGVIACAIYLSLIKYFNAVEHLEMPMLYVAGQLSPHLQRLYALVLFSEIYTTAIGSLYGFVARFTDSGKPLNKSLVLWVSLLGIFASQLGFSNVVKYVYPLIGYCGVVLLVLLLFGKKSSKGDETSEHPLYGSMSKSTHRELLIQQIKTRKR